MFFAVKKFSMALGIRMPYIIRYIGRMKDVVPMNSATESREWKATASNPKVATTTII